MGHASSSDLDAMTDVNDSTELIYKSVRSIKDSYDNVSIRRDSHIYTWLINALADQLHEISTISSMSIDRVLYKINKKYFDNFEDYSNNYLSSVTPPPTDFDMRVIMHPYYTAYISKLHTDIAHYNHLLKNPLIDFLKDVIKMFEMFHMIYYYCFSNFEEVYANYPVRIPPNLVNYNVLDGGVCKLATNEQVLSNLLRRSSYGQKIFRDTTMPIYLRYTGLDNIVETFLKQLEDIIRMYDKYGEFIYLSRIYIVPNGIELDKLPKLKKREKILDSAQEITISLYIKDIGGNANKLYNLLIEALNNLNVYEELLYMLNLTDDEINVLISVVNAMIIQYVNSINYKENIIPKLLIDSKSIHSLVY